MNPDEFTEHRRRGKTDYFVNERRRPYPLTDPGMEWTRLGACRSAPVGIFFPNGNPGTLAVTAVMDYCGTCPVAADCLRHALLNEEFGWWAGTSAQERIRLRRVLDIPFSYEMNDNRREAEGVPRRLASVKGGAA